MLSPLKRLVAAVTLLGAAGLVTIPGSPSSAAPGDPVLSISNASASEGDGVIEFDVALNKPARQVVSAWVVTADNTARRGSDYTGKGFTVSIPRGATTATVAVPLVDDDVVEPEEYFRLRVSRVVGANVGTRQALGTITDDGLAINVLHINDHHSHLDPTSGSVNLGTTGGTFNYSRGGFPRVVQAIDELSSQLDNVVKIHAGDAVTGTLYYSLYKGQADADLMNLVCFDIFELGNHEFDDSDAGAARFLDWLAAGNCDTTVLGANVVPEVGTPLAPVALDDYIKPYVVKEFDGQQVGFIGLDIAQKTKVSSSPLDTTQFLDEATTAQQYVDELAAMGIDNIVLVTHLGYDHDLDLAGQVSGIDAIIGGDSHTLLGDFGAFGFTSAGPYPTMAANADGDPVCIAQAWQYSLVVGELNIAFEDGKNVACGGTPHALVGNFTRAGASIKQPELGKIRQRIAAIGTIYEIAPNAEAQALVSVYGAQVEVLKQQVIGTATENLCIERVPGQGRSVICPRDAVAVSGARLNVNGGFISQIVTDAYATRAFRADFAIQNGGGVRVDLAAGDITVADAYVLLPFANTLVELELSGAEVKASLEEAVANFRDNGGSTGSYPYGSGIRWDVDLGQAAGNRFSNIEVKTDAGTWVPLDLGATYIVATNSFLANGGDGMATFRVAKDQGRIVDTFIDYAQGFIDYVIEDAGGVLSVPAPEDFSTQHFTPAP